MVLEERRPKKPKMTQSEDVEFLSDSDLDDLSDTASQSDANEHTLADTKREPLPTPIPIYRIVVT